MSSNKLVKLLHLIGWIIWIVWWRTELRTSKIWTVYSPSGRVSLFCTTPVRYVALISVYVDLCAKNTFLFCYFNETRNLSTNCSKTPKYQVSCNLVWHFPRQHKRRDTLRPDNTLNVAILLSEWFKNAIDLQFTIINQQMHNFIFTPSHYITTLKIPTYSIPCGVIIRQFVHQVSLYKSSINHINLKIFKTMSPRREHIVPSLNYAISLGPTYGSPQFKPHETVLLTHIVHIPFHFSHAKTVLDNSGQGGLKG